MKVNCGMMATTATRYYNIHAQNVGASVYRLSSGKKLLTDDPAGSIIASKFRARIRELDVLIKRNETMQDLANVNAGDLMGRHDILQRMRELSVSMANDTLSESDKKILGAEYFELAKEVGIDIKQKTGFELIAVGNGSLSDKLMFKKDNLVYEDGKWKDINEVLSSLNEVKKLSENGSGEQEDAEIETEESGLSYKDYTAFIDDIMNQNLSSITSLAATSNAMSFKIERMYTEIENATAALSRIEDVDMAKEMVEFAKEKILCEVSLAGLSRKPCKWFNLLKFCQYLQCGIIREMQECNPTLAAAKR